MDLNLLSRSYTVTRLDKADVDICFELMRKNTIFYKHHPPFVTKESPVEKIAFIGFFMTDAEHQNQGVGSKIIREVCCQLKSLGCKKVRLGVDKGNPQSYAFWVKNQFSVINEDVYILMELVL